MSYGIRISGMIGIISFLVLLLSPSGFCEDSANERPWPSEITSQNTQLLFSKIQATLTKTIKERKKITIGLTNNKLIYGSVVKCDDKECTIKDPRGNMIPIAYDHIRGRYLIKLVDAKDQTGDILLTIGIVYFYEKEYDRAKVCFQQSFDLGQNDAEAWIKKNDEILALQTPETDPNENGNNKNGQSGEEIVLDPADAKNNGTKPNTDDPKKLIPKTSKAPNIGKAPKILMVKTTRKVDLASHAVPGAYTLFVFYTNTCSGCKKVLPQIEDVVNKSNAVALRKLDVSNNGPVVNQFKLEYVPFFVLYNMKCQEEKRGGLTEMTPYLSQWKK